MRAVASALRAAVAALLVWLAIQALLFVLVQAAPGGPAAALAGEFATRETQAAIVRSFALDRPVHEQFVSFVWRMAQGDWGTSYYFRRPVAELIAERMVPTLVLMIGALLISVVAGRGLGLWAAAREDRRAVIATAATALYALPVFWVGQLLMLGGGLELQWFPTSGLSNPRHTGDGWSAAADMAWHAVLPVTTLALHHTAFIVTVVHAKARIEMGQDYVRAARARGIPESTIVWRHVGRNVGPQLATAALNRLGMLFTGAVLVETLFAWPGLGRLLSAAILNRDHPVLLGAFGLIVAAVVASSVTASIVQARLDPRIDAALDGP